MYTSWRRLSCGRISLPSCWSWDQGVRTGNPCRLILSCKVPTGMPPANFPSMYQSPGNFCIVSGGFCTRFTKLCTRPVGLVQIVLPGLRCGTNLAARSRNSVGTEPSLHGRLKSAQLLVGVLFDDFTPKRSFSCKNGIKSRKWKQKIKKSPCTRSANGGCDTAGPIAPQPDVGSTHNLSRRQSVMSSCVCQSYGHFQHPVGEQLAPPCFFSVGVSCTPQD